MQNGSCEQACALGALCAQFHPTCCTPKENSRPSAMILKFEGALKKQMSQSIYRVLFETRHLGTYVVLETATSVYWCGECVHR